jgi:hypothetical protein
MHYIAARPSKEPIMSFLPNVERGHSFCGGKSMRDVRQRLLKRFEQQRDPRKKSMYLPLFLLIFLGTLALSTSLVVVYAYKASIPMSRLLVVGAMHHDHVRFKEVAFLNKFKLYGAYEDYMDALNNRRQQQQQDIESMESDGSKLSNPVGSNSAPSHGSEQYSLFANRGRYINIPMAATAPIVENDVGTGKVMHQARGTGFNLYSVAASTYSSDVVSETERNSMSNEPAASTYSSDVVSETERNSMSNEPSAGNSLASKASQLEPEFVGTVIPIINDSRDDLIHTDGMLIENSASKDTIFQASHGFGNSNSCNTLNDPCTSNMPNGSEQIVVPSLESPDYESRTSSLPLSTASLSYPDSGNKSNSSTGSQRATAPITATFKETISAYGSVRNPLNGYDLSSNTLLNGYAQNDPLSHTKSGREIHSGDSRAALKSLNGENHFDSSSTKFQRGVTPSSAKTVETATFGTIRNPLNGYDLSSNTLIAGVAQNDAPSQAVSNVLSHHGTAQSTSTTLEENCQIASSPMNEVQSGFNPATSKKLETVAFGSIRNPLNGYDLSSNSLLNCVDQNDGPSGAESGGGSHVDDSQSTIKPSCGSTPLVVKAVETDNSLGAIRNPLNVYDLNSKSLLNDVTRDDPPSEALSGEVGQPSDSLASIKSSNVEQKSDLGLANHFQHGATPPLVKAAETDNSLGSTSNPVNCYDLNSNSMLNYVAAQNSALSGAESGEVSHPGDYISTKSSDVSVERSFLSSQNSPSHGMSVEHTDKPMKWNDNDLTASVDATSSSHNAVQKDVPTLFSVSGPGGASAASSTMASSDISIDVGFIRNPLSGYDLNASFKPGAGLLQKDARSHAHDESNESENIMDRLCINSHDKSDSPSAGSQPSFGNDEFLLNPLETGNSDRCGRLEYGYEPSVSLFSTENVHVNTIPPNKGDTSSAENVVGTTINLESTSSEFRDVGPIAPLPGPPTVSSHNSVSPIMSTHEPPYFGNLDMASTDFTKFSDDIPNEKGLPLPSTGKTMDRMISTSTGIDTTILNDIAVPTAEQPLSIVGNGNFDPDSDRDDRSEDFSISSVKHSHAKHTMNENAFDRSNQRFGWGISSMGTNRVFGGAVDFHEQSLYNIDSTGENIGSLGITLGNFHVQSNRFFDETRDNTLSQLEDNGVESGPLTNFNIGVNRVFDRIVDFSTGTVANDTAVLSPENFYMGLNRFDHLPSELHFVNDISNSSPKYGIHDFHNNAESNVSCFESEPNMHGQDMLEHFGETSDSDLTASIGDSPLSLEMQGCQERAEGENLHKQVIALNSLRSNETVCAKKEDIHHGEIIEPISDFQELSTSLDLNLDSPPEPSSSKDNTLENLNATGQPDISIAPMMSNCTGSSSDEASSTNVINPDIPQEFSSINFNSSSATPNSLSATPEFDPFIDTKNVDGLAQHIESRTPDLKSFPSPPGRIETSTSLNMHNEWPSGSESIRENSFPPFSNERPTQAFLGVEKVYGNTQTENRMPVELCYSAVQPESIYIPDPNNIRDPNRIENPNGKFSDRFGGAFSPRRQPSNQVFSNPRTDGNGQENAAFIFQSQQFYDEGNSGLGAIQYRDTTTAPHRPINNVCSEAPRERNFNRAPETENHFHPDMNTRFSRSDFYVPSQEQATSNRMSPENGNQFNPGINTGFSRPDFNEHPREQVRQPPPMWENMYNRGPVPNESQFVPDMNTRFSPTDFYMYPQEHGQQRPAMDERSFHRAPPNESQYGPSMSTRSGGSEPYAHPHEHAQQAPPTWESGFDRAPEHRHPFLPNRPAPANENPLVPDMSTRFSGSNFYRHPQEQAQVQHAPSQLWQPNHNEDRSMDDFLNDDSGINRFRLSRGTAPLAPDKGSGPKENFKSGR